MLDQDHKDAAVNITTTATGFASAKVAQYFHMPSLADWVNIATLVFVIMQAGLLVPKYVTWFKIKVAQWKTPK